MRAPNNVNDTQWCIIECSTQHNGALLSAITSQWRIIECIIGEIESTVSEIDSTGGEIGSRW
jgi:hypothetical protein